MTPHDVSVACVKLKCVRRVNS